MIFLKSPLRIQDEIEFGHSYSIKADGLYDLPVVFNGPRNQGLDNFAHQVLQDKNLGNFRIDGKGRSVNSLNSFGNLEVSPPVFLKNRNENYPFGRIIFGGEQFANNSAKRKIIKEVKGFLYAQKVQAPIEIFTEWLRVGHVDEIISFVPADNDIKFKMLIASPDRAITILEEYYKTHKNSVLFHGKMMPAGIPEEFQNFDIKGLLGNKKFRRQNEIYQGYINHNQNILERELGISDQEIIKIPVLYYKHIRRDRALAYFPNMVNHLVLNQCSFIPKPHGPKNAEGECIFEEAFRKALPNRVCEFIDDWHPYFLNQGGIHCGTNVLREPFKEKWWEYKPPNTHDI